MSQSERRRFTRKPLTLDARVTAGGTDSLPCQIRDFCPGGLFIAVSGIDDDHYVSLERKELDRGDLVQVHFRADESEYSETAEVTARISGVFNGGMGLEFQDADPVAVQTLEALADKQVESHEQAIAAMRTSSRSASTADSAAVADRIADLLSEFLQTKGNAVFETADESLFSIARDATSNVEELKFVEAQREVKKLQPAVCKSFLANGMRGIKQPGNAPGDPDSRPPQEKNASELTIVDSGSFHDVLKTKQILGRNERRFKDSEFELEQRLTVLFGVPIDEDTNPVGVRAICFAFHESMQDLGASKRTRGEVFAAFEKIVVGNLDGLHSATIDVLNEAGVATEFEQRSFKVPKVPKSERPEPGPPESPEVPKPGTGGGTGVGVAAAAASGTGGAAPTVGSENQGGAEPPPSAAQAQPTLGPLATGPGMAAGGAPTAGYPAPGVGENDSSDEVSANRGLDGEAPAQTGLHGHTPVSPTGYAPAGSGVGPAGYAPAAPGAGPAAGYPGVAPGHGGMPAPSTEHPEAEPSGALPVEARSAAVLSNGFAAAQSLLRWARQPAAGQASAQTGPRVSPATVDVISRLQQSLPNDALPQTSPLAVRDRVIAAMSEQGDGVSDEEQDAIDVVANLLNSVMDDPLIGNGAKSRIRRLALPLLKTVLTDASFLEDLSHPARGIVDELGHLEFDGEDGEEIQSRVDPMVERLASEINPDQQFFAEMRASLEQISNDQKAAYLEKAQDLAAARDQEQTIIKARVVENRRDDTGRRIPEELRQWLTRARHLKIGDAVIFQPSPGKKNREMLAWVSADQAKFQFVDPSGNKASWLTDQQLAIEMRRGSATPVTGSDLPAMERGLYQMLHEMHSKLADVATRDELTGLINRREFDAQVERALEAARREETEHSVFALKIDGLSNITERCGPKAGGSLLRQLARVLEKNVSAHSGCVGRVETNTFGVLLERASGSEGAQFAERQRNAIEQSRCMWKGELFPLSVSIGVVVAGPKSRDADALIEAAVAACLRARDEGGNRVVVDWSAEPALSQPDDEVSETPTVDWSGRVTEALDDGTVALQYQLVQPLTGGKTAKPHYEVLLGIADEDGNLRSARDLLKAAECENLMSTVDRWVVANALRWMSANRKKILKSSGFAINVSASAATDSEFVEYVIEQLTESKVPPAKVQFEFKERVALDNLSVAADFINVLREYGCRFSLDHFGTGDASYAYLKRLPVDYIKIDGSFVRGMTTNENDLAVVKSVNEIGHLLGIKTVAEFVETEEHLDRLREIGVDFAQGHGVESPIPLDSE